MFRSVSAVFLVILCMTMSGCAAIRHLDGSVDEETKKLEQYNEEIKKLEQYNETCRLNIQEKKREIDELTRQVANLNKDMEGLKTEVEQAKEAAKKEIAKEEMEDKSSNDQISPVEEKLITADIKDAPQSTVEKKVEPKILKVKVLSGNGKMSSAGALSEKLTKLGYKIENTGLAPRSNFDVVTIYFAPDYKSEAQHMATQLGGNAIAKPLTWPSVFHVIVVTGH